MMSARLCMTPALPAVRVGLNTMPQHSSEGADMTYNIEAHYAQE